ncbi:probable tubulin polyglutamylase ttll-15 [Chironomus tepperi]|uniref:probable tubulin polyglutamylase ttll-15 n=1 Tax=Chironomus tepperi TaxID=113505 RepID=UPI00391F26D1
MWSIEFPFDRFPEKISTIKPNQRINHFPGTPSMGNKRAFVTTVNSEYVLPAFSFPRDEEKFQKYIKENPNARFVEKNYDNRGVQLVSKDAIQKVLDRKNKFIQVFLENPLLIDGHIFDIGIYVLITSIDPLVIYRYKPECLFRFCSEPYHPFDPKNLKQYVIADNKKHAWNMKSFQRLDGHYNFNNLDIFKNYLRNNGHDVEALFKKFDDAIIEAVALKVRKLIEATQKECKKFKCTKDNFFELFRFDFMVDDKLNVYLLEINMSPNLTPSKKEYERNGIHYEHVVYNTLRLIGAEGFVELNEELRNSQIYSLPQNIAIDAQACSECDDKCESESCYLCLPCMSEDEREYLQRFYREHNRRGEFKRIFPSAASVDIENLATFTEKTQKLAHWLSAKCEMDDEWC